MLRTSINIFMLSVTGRDSVLMLEYQRHLTGILPHVCTDLLEKMVPGTLLCNWSAVRGQLFRKGCREGDLYLSAAQGAISTSHSWKRPLSR